MSPEQCQATREVLKWTRRELADAADVPLWFVAAFENGDDGLAFLAHWEIQIRENFEAVGIGLAFEIENEQFKPAGVTYSPLDKGGAN
jgi:hypothetical protein